MYYREIYYTYYYISYVICINILYIITYSCNSRSSQIWGFTLGYPKTVKEKHRVKQRERERN